METNEEKEINDKIDEWHDNSKITIPLHEFLGMSWEEFEKFLKGEN